MIHPVEWLVAAMMIRELVIATDCRYSAQTFAVPLRQQVNNRYNFRPLTRPLSTLVCCCWRNLGCSIGMKRINRSAKPGCLLIPMMISHLFAGREGIVISRPGASHLARRPRLPAANELILANGAEGHMHYIMII